MNLTKHTSRSTFAWMLLLLWAGLSACSSPDPNQPRVFFTSPSNGATVTSPVKVTMDAANFIIEPAGTVRPGAGHLHIMIDTDCMPVGQMVPKDDTHRHFGQGEKQAELTLSPGTHTLCLQATDGAHVALPGEGMTQKITVTVK
ncbi:MAG TPA: DUF4399 domain-containing protein [Blastocatellia bacterium]|nr:DUF4399 domain-containing protein [Blastocatellia bacterium]